ncbi:MAG: hypothetical protein JXA30_08790 [Deltaproteobacteria bacterium]|nr:hypothetical protein [Deltaproteobacteria bacterium]
MVLAVPDGCRWKCIKRSGRESAKLYVSSGTTQGPKDPSTPARGRKPGLRDELAPVVVKQQYPPERLLSVGAREKAMAGSGKRTLNRCSTIKREGIDA